MSQGIVYLACPYTTEQFSLREFRFQAANRAAARLIRKGYIVYSPITMTHPIDVELAGTQATLGSDFWVSFDEAFMDVCAELIVLRLQGWTESSGIRRELAYFASQGKKISYIDDEV